MLQNRGGAGDVFSNEPDALAWLDSRLGPGERTLDVLNRPRDQE
jgi:hypothetical protein